MRLRLDSGKTGGGERDRTDDLLLAKQALSQLSYTPGIRTPSVVGLVGFEPTTPALSRRCSNQLSYRPPAYPSSGPGAARRHKDTSPPCATRCCKNQPISVGARIRRVLEKGGDPAAPSGTATLLRLHPSHEAHRGRRPPCG
jgi:hypothetical protein